MRTLGFTLVETLICLAVIGLLAGYAIPSLREIVKQSQGIAVVNWLVTSVAYTRSSAIDFDTNVTLCPSADGKSCGGHWQEGMIVFTDANLDHTLDGKDVLLHHFQFPVDDGSVTWHAFQNRQYLQMTGQGYTHYQNGNFVYCPGDGDARYARQLVINIQGRTRPSHDTNGDGFVEDRYGHHLKCPMR